MAEALVVEWRADIESLAFRPAGHDGFCVVHRRAFETLLGHVASAEECTAYLRACEDSFQRAATVKIAQAGLGAQENFHLTSRDIARAPRG
jgi:hypothetical protein